MVEAELRKIPTARICGTHLPGTTSDYAYAFIEHLFSTAGGVITEHRARLITDNGERLIFFKSSASLIKSE